MVDILEKVSFLTTIDKKALLKLSEKAEWCICDAIYQDNESGNYKCFCDIGIGTIGVDYTSGDTIKYKFIPSKDFEKMLITTLLDKKSPLVTKTEQSLVKKITDTYKDLF